MRIVSSIEDLKGKTNTKLGMRKQKVASLPKASLSQDTRENMELLEECRRWWESLRDFRDRRMRSRKYYRGDQWSDTIYDSDTGDYITEETYLMNQGKVPLKQNRIRSLVENLIGQYRSNPSKPIVLSRGRENAQQAEMLTNALQCALDNNDIKDLDPRLFEEFILSGAGVQKVGYSYWKERNLEDLYLENVNVNRMFFNADVSDIRLKDLRLIGEIIDTTVEDIVSKFAHNTAEEELIRESYANLVSKDFYSDYGLDSSRVDSMDFYNSHDPNKARLYEIWKLRGEWRVYAHDPLDGSYSIVPYTLKEIAQQNDERIRMGLEQGIPLEEVPLIEAEEKFEQFWYVKFLTPFGHCLYESETPYSHEEHPYAILLFPLLDGEVWGFIEDIIDQQRYINRMIILLDFIIGASAKGVLMVPKDMVPEDMTEDEFADKWRRFDSVIFYTPRADGQVPRQISANSTQVGIFEMLNLQMSLLDKNSGISESIQGQRAPAGTPAALYAQEAQNSTLNVVDQIQSFHSLLQRRNRKALKVITQFYKEKRYLAINGRATSDDARIFDPELIKNLDFETVVTSGVDTPVYRQMIDDTLLELLKGNLIDLEMFLEHTSLPFADKLLASVRAQKQAMDNGGNPGAIAPELMQQANQANPQSMALLQQAMGMGQRKLS